MDNYTIFFLIFFILASIAIYFLYLFEKGDKLKEINNGICPKCKNKSVEIVNQKSHGCSGTQEITIECKKCGYKDSFTISNNGCGGGSCRI